jgi:hypothetical protein
MNHQHGSIADGPDTYLTTVVINVLFDDGQLGELVHP